MDDVLEDDGLRLVDVLLEEALATAAAATVRPRRRWLAAAVALFGTLVVFGVGWFARVARDAATAPTQPPQEPGHVRPAPPSLPANAVRLRVLDREDEPVHAFVLGLRQVLPGQALSFAGVPSFPDRAVAARDLDGDALVIQGLPDGEFVLQVTADRDARARSAPLRVGAGQAPAEVTVRLWAGGELHGQVRDAAGNPVAGAVVATGPDTDFDFRSDAYAMIRPMLPDVVTVAQTRTDADGRYALPRLATGRYQLCIEHPDHCAGIVRALVVADEQPLDVPPVALDRGAVVEGIVAGAGAQPGAVKVTIMRPVPAGATAPAAPFPFAMTVAADAQGRYRFDRRLAPGSYEICAYRAAEGNALLQAAAIRQGARPLVVAPGQDRIEQGLELPR
jgi:hypothetical protein